ncbi:hypothetical protein NOGI109294_15435 [Nocardiopsis gilva]
MVWPSAFFPRASHVPPRATSFPVPSLPFLFFLPLHCICAASAACTTADSWGGLSEGP